MNSHATDMATLELQREHALRLADRIRCGRSKLLHVVRDGRLTVPGLFRGDYDTYTFDLAATAGHRELGTVTVAELLHNMRVLDLMCAHPGLGPARSIRGLVELGIQPWHCSELRLNQLSPARRRQLATIVDHLGHVR